MKGYAGAHDGRRCRYAVSAHRVAEPERDFLADAVVAGVQVVEVVRAETVRRGRAVLGVAHAVVVDVEIDPDITQGPVASIQLPVPVCVVPDEASDPAPVLADRRCRAG
jgi:hypothetical protein